jgi:hypothetical protein
MPHANDDRGPDRRRCPCCHGPKSRRAARCRGCTYPAAGEREAMVLAWLSSHQGAVPFASLLVEIRAGLDERRPHPSLPGDGRVGRATLGDTLETLENGGLVVRVGRSWMHRMHVPPNVRVGVAHGR